MGNAGSGIRLDGSSNTMIGGTTEAERNVIAANGGYGIWVRDPSNDTSIQGNFWAPMHPACVPLGNVGSGDLRGELRRHDHWWIGARGRQRDLGQSGPPRSLPPWRARRAP